VVRLCRLLPTFTLHTVCTTMYGIPSNVCGCAVLGEVWKLLKAEDDDEDEDTGKDTAAAQGGNKQGTATLRLCVRMQCSVLYVVAVGSAVCGSEI
jgi:hypothetical protein